MSLRRETLSVIKEATERSDSDLQSSYSRVDVVVEEFSQDVETVDNLYGPPRGSIFSSETSYGELLPPGQSVFRSLGLGVSLPSMYEKSLPSLPRGSIAKTTSARSILQTESAGGSGVKSVSSRHSIPKSAASIRSAIELESPRHASIRKLSDPSFPTPWPAHGSVSSGATPFIPPSLPSNPPSSSSSTTTSVTTAKSSSSRSGVTCSVLSQSTLRTVDDVLDEVTTSLALRTKLHSETVPTSDHTKIGVCSTMSYNDNEHFMRVLAAKLHQAMTLQGSYLFGLLPSSVGGPLEAAATLVFCGAPQHLVTKAAILAGLRFKTRLAEVQDSAGTWIGFLEPPPLEHENLHPQAHDEDILWDIVRKAANPIDPAEPPPGSRGIDQLLNDARARLDRLEPREAFKEALEEGILVDIRPEVQRAAHGGIPGSVIMERNVLEWRFDPRSSGRLPIADRYDLRVIIFCQEGYTSSLAAASLQDIGLWRATDIGGGFLNWKSEGLPTLILDDPRSERDL